MSVEEIGNIMETSNFRLWLSNHDKQIRADAINECIKFVDEWDNVIADALANKLKEQK